MLMTYKIKGVMKFNVDKFKEISRQMTQEERQEMECRNESREWLALSAKFALLVRRILREEGMTQKEMARRMGVSSVQVTKLLSGKENISLQTIAKVEKALGRSLISFQDNIEVETAVSCPPDSCRPARSLLRTTERIHGCSATWNG